MAAVLFWPLTEMRRRWGMDGGGGRCRQGHQPAPSVFVCVVGSANPPFMCGEELRRSDHTPARPLIDVFVVMPRLPSPSPFVSVLPSLFVRFSLPVSHG